jgi:DNA-binding beta-propeller fold protein YncE
MPAPDTYSHDAIVGSGDYQYEVKEHWGQLPAGWRFRMVSDVAVDSKGRVFILQRRMDKPRHPTIADMDAEDRIKALDDMEPRRESPVIVVFDRDGNYVTSWDSPIITLPTGLSVDPEDHVWITDRDNHVVMKFTANGNFLMELGTRGRPSDTGCSGYGAPVLQPGKPFNEPNKAIQAPWGDVYVADGDRNCRVHRFTSNGVLLSSWGTPGDGPVQFRSPHSVYADKGGLLYVCDRSNERVQVLTRDGDFVTQWFDFDHPTDICMDAAEETVFVTGQGQQHRVSVLDRQGKLLARWKPPASNHGIAVDARGDLYVAHELDLYITKYVRL